MLAGMKGKGVIMLHVYNDMLWFVYIALISLYKILQNWCF